MEMNQLGKTGLQISRLGLGLAQGKHKLTMDDFQDAADVLDVALEAGINFLDTGACYGLSEEFIGRLISHRRGNYILATKCGHLVEGEEGEPWTPHTIRHSIERSLSRMKTDYLDLIQLHSCSVAILEHGEVIAELERSQKQGLVRFLGYSGDNEAAEWAVSSGVFDTIQTSFNIVDQRARWNLFKDAKAAGMGTIIKRPIANVSWGAKQSPSTYADTYFERGKKMEELGTLPVTFDDPLTLALGFALSYKDVDTAIVGTRDHNHMRANLERVNRGIHVPDELLRELEKRFDALGSDWLQLN
jgi:aryl-alcohol dehydrogenase-like predicted oxidoreductase